MQVAVPERRSFTYESRLLKYVKRGYSIAIPNLRLDEVQLKKPVKQTSRRFQLDENHPKYLPRETQGAWESVFIGWEFKFDSSWRSSDKDKPSMYDYFESKCLRKLLIANIAGREIFQRENRRSKFVQKSRNTMEIAMYIMSLGEHYGPSAPDVPGSSLYAVSGQGPAAFLNAKRGAPGYIEFKIGGIPTGTEEVGGTDEWDAECYIPLTIPDE